MMMKLIIRNTELRIVCRSDRFMLMENYNTQQEPSIFNTYVNYVYPSIKYTIGYEAKPL